LGFGVESTAGYGTNGVSASASVQMGASSTSSAGSGNVGAGYSYGYGNYSQGNPAPVDFALGAYAGSGIQIGATNATNVSQLNQTTTTVSVNGGEFLNNFGFSVSYGNGIWSVTVSPPIISAGFGASMAVTHTNTVMSSTKGPC
jgi:hypothetical protein